MAMSRLGSLALVLVAVAPLDARSQTQFVTVRGAVIDSVHGRLLPGAWVSIDGTSYTAVSDSLGRFRMDSVPSGAYRFALYNPFLDSLALSVSSPPIQLAPGVETHILLGVPSRYTLFTEFCAGDTSARVLVAGRVLDVDSDAPVVHATTIGSVEQISFTFDRTGSGTMRRTTVTRTTKTDDDGRFHLCLPHGAHPSVAADLGNSFTGEIPLDVATGIALPVLYVSHADSATFGTRAGLTGRVRTIDGRPLDGATISVDGSTVTTTSASDGSFHLAGAPSGTQMVSVRHVGFAELRVPMPFSSLSPHTVTAIVQPRVATLAKVQVTGKVNALLVAGAYARTGFSARRKGPVGHFLTADDIARRNVGQTTSLLRSIPGVAVTSNFSGTGVRVVSTHQTPIGAVGPTKGVPKDVGNRNRVCTTFVVNGVTVPPGLDDDDQNLPPPRDLIAIEVYQPEESFTGLRTDNCLTVVIWTKAMLNGAGN